MSPIPLIQNHQRFFWRGLVLILSVSLAACAPSSGNTLDGSVIKKDGGTSADAGVNGFSKSLTLSCGGACGSARFFAFDGDKVVMTDTNLTFEASPQTGTVTQTPSGTFPSSIPGGAAACAVGSSLFILGGGGDGLFGEYQDPHWRAQNLTTGEWSTGASSWFPHNAGLAALNGQCVSVGGQLNLHADVGTPQVQSFNASSQLWTPLPNLPMPVTKTSVAVAGGQLLVAGGECYQVDNCPSATQEFFFAQAWMTDLSQPTPSWNPVPDMPSSRIFGYAVASGGLFYVIGGTVDDTGTQPVPETISWAPGDAAWQIHGPAPTQGLVAVYADSVGIFGLAPNSSGNLDVLRWSP